MVEKRGVILIVDDERDHADGIAEALEKLEVETIAVYDGKDALEILRSQRIDVVVTDLKLGGEIDGQRDSTGEAGYDIRRLSLGAAAGDGSGIAGGEEGDRGA